MIDIIKPCASVPYNVFCEYYKKALTKNQQSIEAIFISSLDTNANEVDSRAVNLKYIIDDIMTYDDNRENERLVLPTWHKEFMNRFNHNIKNRDEKLLKCVFTRNKDSIEKTQNI